MEHVDMAEVMTEVMMLIIENLVLDEVDLTKALVGPCAHSFQSKLFVKLSDFFEVIIRFVIVPKLLAINLGVIELSELIRYSVDLDHEDKDNQVY